MRFLPYDDFELHIKMNPTNAFYKLDSVVGTQKTWLISPINIKEPYWGDLDIDSFKISRVIWYRNSFKPVILGRIYPEASGTRIQIVMRLDWFVFFFWIFWLTGVGFIGFNMYSDLLISTLRSGESITWSPWQMIPVGMFAFGYLLTLIGYKIEAAISIKFIFDLFDIPPKSDNVIFHNNILGLSEFQLFALGCLLIVALILLSFIVKSVL
jgi:hypothetical protein